MMVSVLCKTGYFVFCIRLCSSAWRWWRWAVLFPHGCCDGCGKGKGHGNGNGEVYPGHSLEGRLEYLRIE